MILLDYLFYYLTYWFEKNKDKLSWSTPVQRSSYAIGLATIALICAISEVLAFTIYKKNNGLYFPKFLFVLLALTIMYLYDYIYIKRDRYSSITSKFSGYANKNYGVIISFIVVVLAIFSPFIVFTIFVPFGDQR